MALSDVLFTSVDRANPSNSQTISLQSADQTRASDFLTVQSLANFAAMTGAITVAWKALQAVSESTFSARWTPFVLALLWLAVSLTATAAQEPALRKSPGFWVTAIFIGILNSAVLFGAVIGITA
jgi:hypothetical protein